MRTFCQCRIRREVPLAVGIGQSGADFYAIVVDMDNRTGFTGTAKGRRGVVGVTIDADLAFLRRDVIVEAVDQWLRRCHGVDNDLVAWRWFAFVAVLIDRHDDDFMLAISQARCRRGVFPLTVFAHDGSTNGFTVVDDFNAGARTTRTGERRGTVIRRAAIFDQALLGADIVVHATKGALISTSATRSIVAIAVIIACCSIDATHHTQRGQAQQSRPEPAYTGSRHQAVAETRQ